MNRELAREILPLVNDHDFYAMVKSYADYRIKELKDQFLGVYKMDDVARIQGAIMELKRFATLRDEVLLILKKE
jgi:hypothetical protein